MYVYIYKYSCNKTSHMNIHTCEHTYIDTSIDTYTYIHTSKHARTHASKQASKHACMHACTDDILHGHIRIHSSSYDVRDMFLYMCLRVPMYMYVRVCVCIYIYVCIHTSVHALIWGLTMTRIPDMTARYGTSEMRHATNWYGVGLRAQGAEQFEYACGAYCGRWFCLANSSEEAYKFI